MGDSESSWEKQGDDGAVEPGEFGRERLKRRWDEASSSSGCE